MFCQGRRDSAALCHVSLSYGPPTFVSRGRAALLAEFRSAMTMRRTYESKGRKLIFLLVLLGHCVLIVVISRSNTAQQSATHIHEPLVVFFLGSIKEKTEADTIKDPAPAKARSRLRYPSTVPLTMVPPRSDVDATSSNAITDWYAQAHSVAEDALENDRRKGAKRAFEHKMPSAQEREEASIFDPLPVRRAGTWDGPDRFYITDNCAYEWDPAPRPPPTLLDNHLKTPVCKPPPKGGGDAMFKGLTPDYLKALPEHKSR
jgi:hypothetical protein